MGDQDAPLAAPLILLAIDTCGAMGSVAVGRIESAGSIGDAAVGGSVQVLASADLQGKTYAAVLVSRIEEILRQAGLAPAAISAVIVVNGPGSFTGIRVGVSAAKGLAEGLGVPLIAVSRLELLARQAESVAAVPQVQQSRQVIKVALDAGRGEFYYGEYRAGVQHIEALYTREEVLAAVRDSGERLIVCETGAALNLSDGLSGNLSDDLSDASLRLTATPQADDALIVGAGHLRAGRLAAVDTLDGNYLRRPDAENSTASTATSS